MNSPSSFCFRSRDFVGFLIVRTFVFCCLICQYGCENEKNISQEDSISEFDTNLSISSDENMYTSDEGEFMVDYDVEFLPYSSFEEKDMQEGMLYITKIYRDSIEETWKAEQSDCQRISYPIENTLPLFLITDNLQIEDYKEGFMLNFFDKKNRLLRSISHSVEEWLIIIGEIRQSHYGYLPVDLSDDSDNLLSR